MQKHHESRIRQTLKRLFNIRLWMSADSLMMFASFLKKTARQIFVISQHDTTESFEEACARLNVTDEILTSRACALRRMSQLLCLLNIGLLIYLGYQCFYGHIRGILMTTALIGMVGAMAFRYHFWSFQIKEKKLGCSLREWYQYGVRGEKR